MNFLKLLKILFISKLFDKTNDWKNLGYGKSLIKIIKDSTDLLIKSCSTKIYWVCLNLIWNCIL